MFYVVHFLNGYEIFLILSLFNMNIKGIFIKNLERAEKALVLIKQ